MENASKALLIVASLLIVILLIAMGMRVFNEGSKPIDETEDAMKTVEKGSFNAKFSQYLGTKNKSQVIALLNTVISNNSTNTDHQIKINDKNSITDLTLKVNNTAESTVNEYKISIEAYDGKGYISKIKVIYLSGASEIKI